MDLYIVLGLRHGASESEIRRAYRRLARKFHPDINPGDRVAEVRFGQILEAYETLVDPNRRTRYDAGQGEDPEPVRGRAGFEGFDFSASGPDYSAAFGDLFAEVLSDRASRRASPVRGADLHSNVTLSFDDSLRGAQRAVVVTRQDTCVDCAGTGVMRASGGACQVCQASGVVRSSRGHMVFSRRCHACAGSGTRAPRACTSCSGQGSETRAETVHARIPGGIVDGDRVRIAGKGHVGLQGGAAGDLFITVHVEPHPVFRRVGDDLHMVLPIAVHEAALGCRVELPTPEGSSKLRVPPGTQSGQRFRLREHGALSTRDGRRGDLLVEVRIMLPAVLDERSKELLREFARIHGGALREEPPE